MSPRPPPKISLKHDWKRELGSEDAQRPDGQVVQQFKSSLSNQPTPNPDHDRTGQPVVGTDRTGQPVVEPTQGSRQVEENRPFLRRSKHVLFIKMLLNMTERGNPLLKQEQPKHVHLMTARASTLKIKRHMIERGNPL